ncbi:MAG: outer membrane protein assembly factor BamB [Gammaproteobacteria bacterium]
MFSNLRVFLLLIVVSTCFGCGAKQAFNNFMTGDDNSEPPTELADFAESTQLNEVWSKNVGKGTDELFIKLLPAGLDDKIFIADTRGNIAGLFADTGKNVWKNKSKLSITGGPGADSALVMVGTSEGEVLSLSAETGEELWRSAVSSEILSSPKESDGVVVIRTIDGKIFALDATDGKRLWVYDRTVPALTLRGTSTPVISNGLIIAGFDGGRLTALELKTGKLVWETKVAISRGRSELERMVDIDAQPLIVDDVIYVTTFQANVSALALDSGTVLWQRDISSHSELGADESNLYVTEENGHVWAIDRFSGSSIWQQEKLAHRKVTGPAVLGDRVVIGDLEGYLHWLDKSTGAISGRVKIDSDPILTQPIISNETLFAYSSGGTLAAYTYVGIEPKYIPEEITETSAGESSSEETTAQAPQEESKGFFGSIVDIFTGESEDEEE